MSFFNKLKERLFKSSSKLDEGLEEILTEAPPDALSEPSPAADGVANNPAPPAPVTPPASSSAEAKPGLLGRIFGATVASAAPVKAEARRLLDDAMLESLEDLL